MKRSPSDALEGLQAGGAVLALPWGKVSVAGWGWGRASPQRLPAVGHHLPSWDRVFPSVAGGMGLEHLGALHPDCL